MRRGEKAKNNNVRISVLFCSLFAVECFTPVFGNGTSSLGVLDSRKKHTSASISLIYYPPMSVQSEKKHTHKKRGHTFSTVVDMMPVVPNYATKSLL
jgi:hypothetical protein